jgi:cell division protein FtsI/penicillin-binding protein 2
MQFNSDSVTYSYVVEKESGQEVLYINYNGAPFIPDICDSPQVMERTIEVLVENPSVSRIVFVQSKNYNYDFKETSYLLELAQLYTYLVNQEKILTYQKIS